MAPWKVVKKNDRTYLVTRETYYEVIALRPVPISQEIEDSESKEIVSALEEFARFDKTSGLTLYPYLDVDTGRMIVPGDEHRYRSSENVTMAIACIVAEKPWKQHIPFGEFALANNDSTDDDNDDDGGAEYGELSELEHQITRNSDEGQKLEETQMTVEELRRAKRLARKQIEQARAAFNRRSKGDASVNFKTWDDIRNARDNGIIDDDDDDNDDESVSWGEVTKDIENSCFAGAKKQKTRLKSSLSESSESCFDNYNDSSNGENRSSSRSSDDTDSSSDASESSVFDDATAFSNAGSKKRSNGFDIDYAENRRNSSSDTFDAVDNSNFSRKTQNRASKSRKQKSQRSLRKAPELVNHSTTRMQPDVTHELTAQWNAKKEQQRLAEQGQQWQTQNDETPDNFSTQPALQTDRESSGGTHIPVPQNAYAVPQEPQQRAGVRFAPPGNNSQQQQQQQQQQPLNGNDFKSGYGRPGSMPNGIPVINIDMTQVDEDESSEYDSTEDFGSDNENLTMYNYNPKTGFLSAKSSDEKQGEHQKRVGSAVITQASGELKNMQEYRDRLSTVRNTDHQSQVALNFLEVTAAADNGCTLEEQQLKSHPARMALAQEYSPENAHNDTNNSLPPEEDCDVLLPTNIEVDPDTGRVVRRLDDNLMGLTHKEASRAMRRRRRKAAAGLDAIDASRRTINSVMSGEAYRETLERQKREQEQREIEEKYLKDGAVQCDEYELAFLENYLEGEGRGCENDKVWNAIVKYVRENSTLHEDKETGERSIERPAMLPLEEFEQIARGKLSPFTANNINSWSAKSNPDQNDQQKRKSQIPSNETPEQATARLAKEMRAFGMPADMLNAAVQTAKYKDQQGDDEVGEFPQSVDEIMHMAKPFKGKRAAALSSKTTTKEDAVKPKKQNENDVETTEKYAADPARSLDVVPYGGKNSNTTSTKTVSSHTANGIGLRDLVTIQSIMNRQLAAVSTQLAEMASLNQKIDQLLLSSLETTHQ